MKAFLTTLPIALVVTACASPTIGTSSIAHQVAYDRMAPTLFTCDDGSQLYAKYSINKEEATLTVSSPKVSWDNQTLVMDRATSASGLRFVNNAHGDIRYDWHTKNDEGLFTFTWASGQEYTLRCVS